MDWFKVRQLASKLVFVNGSASRKSDWADWTWDSFGLAWGSEPLSFLANRKPPTTRWIACDVSEQSGQVVKCKPVDPFGGVCFRLSWVPFSACV